MRALIILQVLFLISTVVFGESTVNLGEIQAHDETKPIGIEIVSGSPEVTIQARRLFQLHGGYAFAKTNEGVFVFRLDEKEGGVYLTIESGQPRQKLYGEMVDHEDTREAIKHACNLAVKKTLGLKGFFHSELVCVGQGEEHGDLFVGDLLFDQMKGLTRDRAKCLSPRWSPDGKQIVYTSYYKSGFPDVCLCDPQSGQRKVIADYTGTNTGGSFSPDGSKMLMILTSSGTADVYLTDRQGRDPMALTQDKGLEASPTWHPNGEKIYYTSDISGRPQVYELDLNTVSQGGKLVRTGVGRSNSEAVVNPVKPDWIAFTAALEGTFMTGLYNTRTGESKAVSSNKMECVEPSWLADGRHLVVTERRSHLQRLAVLDTVTGHFAYLGKKEPQIPMMMGSAFAR